MDSETQELLRASLARLLADADSRPLSTRLVDYGWQETPPEDRSAALRILFELKGERLSADDSLNATLAGLLADALGDESLRAACLVLPASLAAGRPAVRESARGFRVEGVAVGPIGDGPIVLPIGQGLGMIKNSSSLTKTPLHGFDPALGWTAVTGELASADMARMDGENGRAAWESAVAQGRWMVAAELIAIGRHVVGDVASYTKTRKQYGVAIGSFQALQHRLATAHAALVGAMHMVVEAASTGSAWEALVAKALAGRAAEDACTQAQQCYGAIGFTWEQKFHRYLRRCYALDRLFGDYRSLEFEIGAELQASRVVPRIGEF